MVMLVANESDTSPRPMVMLVANESDTSPRPDDIVDRNDAEASGAPSTTIEMQDLSTPPAPPPPPTTTKYPNVDGMFRSVFHQVLWWHPNGDIIPHPLPLDNGQGTTGFREYKQYHIIMNTIADLGGCAMEDRQGCFDYLRKSLVQEHAVCWTKFKLRIKEVSRVFVSQVVREQIWEEQKTQADMEQAAGNEEALVSCRTRRTQAKKLIVDSSTALVTHLTSKDGGNNLIPPSAYLAWSGTRLLVRGITRARKKGVGRSELDSTTLSTTAMASALALMPYVVKGVVVRKSAQPPRDRTLWYGAALFSEPYYRAHATSMNNVTAFSRTNCLYQHGPTTSC